MRGLFYRREHARDGLKSNALSQKVRVIVNAHRERSSVDRLLLQGLTFV